MNNMSFVKAGIIPTSLFIIDKVIEKLDIFTQMKGFCHIHQSSIVLFLVVFCSLGIMFLFIKKIKHHKTLSGSFFSVFFILLVFILLANLPDNKYANSITTINEKAERELIEERKRYKEAYENNEISEDFYRIYLEKELLKSNND